MVRDRPNFSFARGVLTAPCRKRLGTTPDQRPVDAKVAGNEPDSWPGLTTQVAVDKGETDRGGVASVVDLGIAGVSQGRTSRPHVCLMSMTVIKGSRPFLGAGRGIRKLALDAASKNRDWFSCRDYKQTSPLQHIEMCLHLGIHDRHLERHHP